MQAGVACSPQTETQVAGRLKGVAGSSVVREAARGMAPGVGEGAGAWVGVAQPLDS